MKPLKWLRDKSISTILKSVIDTQLSGIGAIVDFELNSRNKSLVLSVLLDGESYPCTIEIVEYTISEINDRLLFRILNSKSIDRPWLNTILQRYVNGKEVELPSQHKSVIRFFLS